MTICILLNICTQPEAKGTYRRTRNFFQMDINARKLLLFFVAGFLDKMFLTILFIPKENTELKVTCSPHVLECNTTALHLEMEECGGRFKAEMTELDSKYWCDFTHFI
ncbi:hypothetical protein QTP86_024008, partial [Hemibagrus guttatus]